MAPMAGRRRAKRATTRKSTTPVANKSPDAVEEELPTSNAEPSTDQTATQPSATESSADVNAAAALVAEPTDGAAVLETLAQSDVAVDEVKDKDDKGKEVVEESGKYDDDKDGGDRVKEVVDGGDNNVGSNDGGKAKKTVKKTVKKVVKKVIKKVPKRVVKGETDVKVEKLEDVSNSNLMVEEQGKKIESDEKKDGFLDSKDGVEKKGGELMEVDNVESVSREETDKGECENENEKKGDVNINESGSREETDKAECENENENEKQADVNTNESCSRDDTDNKDEEKGEVEEGKNEGEDEEMGEKEEELGEGKLFSGELEAMERKKRRKTEIFIGGLDKDATEEDVRKVFGEVGEIVDLRVVMNAKTGKNKGFAFLRYASAADAKKALEKFAKVEICGKQCGATPVEGNDTIYLGNIDKKWKDEDVLKLLQDSGIENIDKVTVMIDPNKSGCNRGFAFVELETSKDAQIAYKKLQTKNVFGKSQNVKVAWAEPLKELDEEEMLKVKTVYAEFIPSSWDEEKVRDTFKRFGDIDDVVLARNLRTTKRKDFAFISYKTREAAVKCIDLFSREINEDGTKVNVKVSLAKPLQKSKKQKPPTKPAVMEAPNKKLKTKHSSSRPSELRNRAPHMVPHYDVRNNQRFSSNADLSQFMREQAAWRPPHTSLSKSSMDMRYSNSLPGRKRQFSMLEADPLYPDVNRYPYSHIDASYPVASSSHNIFHPSGLPSSIAYHQQHSGFPSGSRYGARNYPSNIEIRDNAPGSSSLYRRY